MRSLNNLIACLALIPPLFAVAFAFGQEDPEFHQGELALQQQGKWCPRCLSEMRDFEQRQAAVPEHLTIALLSEPKDWVKDVQFAAANHFPFPLYVLQPTVRSDNARRVEGNVGHCGYF